MDNTKIYKGTESYVQYKYGEEENNLTASSSMDFTLRPPEEEEEDSLDFAEPPLDSLVEVKQFDIWLISIDIVLLLSHYLRLK